MLTKLYILVLSQGLTHTLRFHSYGLEVNNLNWDVLIMFGIGIGCYLLGLAAFTIVKAILHKRKFKKEIKAREGKETQDKDFNS